MTWVFDPAKALCQLHPAEDDVRRTPDHDDFRPNCQNIAYTDRDIAKVRQHATQLQDLVNDHLAPSLRHHRERAELNRLRTIIRRHDHGT
jgi:ethanolamine utilization cobalamin adenosyltransferase